MRDGWNYTPYLQYQGLRENLRTHHRHIKANGILAPLTGYSSTYNGFKDRRWFASRTSKWHEFKNRAEKFSGIFCNCSGGLYLFRAGSEFSRGTDPNAVKNTSSAITRSHELKIPKRRGGNLPSAGGKFTLLERQTVTSQLFAGWKRHHRWWKYLHSLNSLTINQPRQLFMITKKM